MTCKDCELWYLTDKTETLEKVIRRMANVLTYSNNSAECTSTQKAIGVDLREFADRWDDRTCEHPEVSITHAVPDALPTIARLTENGKRLGRPPKVRPDGE